MNVIIDTLKRIFCSHTWSTRGASWKEDERAVCYDTSYIFECRKCGKIKSIYTRGIDCVKTPNKIYNEYMKGRIDDSSFRSSCWPCPQPSYRAPTPPKTGSSIVKEDA